MGFAGSARIQNSMVPWFPRSKFGARGISNESFTPSKLKAFPQHRSRDLGEEEITSKQTLATSIHGIRGVGSHPELNGALVSQVQVRRPGDIERIVHAVEIKGISPASQPGPRRGRNHLQTNPGNKYSWDSRGRLASRTQWCPGFPGPSSAPGGYRTNRSRRRN